LQSALDGKAPAIHGHAIADVTSLQTTLNGKAATSHAHVDADIPNTITIDLASTATALAANPSDCSAGQFATAIAANGNLTCDTPAGGGGSASWGGITGTLSSQTDLQAALDGKAATSHSHVDAEIPNSITIDAATALSANPTDCAANQFATAIAANGNLTCAALTDADVPNTITVNTAATATALSANPTDCTSGQFANAIDASGNLTCGTPAGGGGSGPTVLRTAADVANSTTTFQTVTGLSMSIAAAGTYIFECRLAVFAAATTTAPQLAITGPTSSAIDVTVQQATTATAVHNAVVTAFDTNVNPATGILTPGGPALISGSFVATAAGTFAVRLRSEVAASAVTVKRGGWCEVHSQ
jgi:hypothetical protein